ncbi:hypothetical protein NL466_30455, partial [Klebsiella pneumoniae]|nr:hypothetical protein [Klebsiella pneumoniae]
PTSSPGKTSKLTFFKAWTSPKLLDKEQADSIAVLGGEHFFCYPLICAFYDQHGVMYPDFRVKTTSSFILCTSMN